MSIVRHRYRLIIVIVIAAIALSALVGALAGRRDASRITGVRSDRGGATSTSGVASTSTGGAALPVPNAAAPGGSFGAVTEGVPKTSGDTTSVSTAAPDLSAGPSALDPARFLVRTGDM